MFKLTIIVLAMALLTGDSMCQDPCSSDNAISTQANSGLDCAINQVNVRNPIV